MWSLNLKWRKRESVWKPLANLYSSHLFSRSRWHFHHRKSNVDTHSGRMGRGTWQTRKAEHLARRLFSHLSTCGVQGKAAAAGIEWHISPSKSWYPYKALWELTWLILNCQIQDLSNPQNKIKRSKWALVYKANWFVNTLMSLTFSDHQSANNKHPFFGIMS